PLARRVRAGVRRRVGPPLPAARLDRLAQREPVLPGTGCGPLHVRGVTAWCQVSTVASLPLQAGLPGRLRHASVDRNMTQDRVAPDLRKAAARLGELADEMARGASRPELLAELAITLGQYRLSGGAPSVERRLTPEQALAAVPTLLRWLAQSLAIARNLEAV